jgi:hypothetical protein
MSLARLSGLKYSKRLVKLVMYWNCFSRIARRSANKASCRALASMAPSPTHPQKSVHFNQNSTLEFPCAGFLAYFAIFVRHESGGTKLAAERRKVSFLIEKMTKFEILDFASLEFAACSLRNSEFLRNYSLTYGRRIESST